jgi:hypothetical protein
MNDAVKHEIQRYLNTGDSDPGFTGWPGSTAFERVRNGRAALKAALVAEIEKRGVGRTGVSIIPDDELPGFTRAKLVPMVRGLFPRREQEPVLELLERSIIFLTRTTIVRILEEEPWLHTAWCLANLYGPAHYTTLSLGSIHSNPESVS